MNWILILVLVVGGVPTTEHVVFENRVACEKARHWMIDNVQPTADQFEAKCFKSFDEGQ